MKILHLENYPPQKHPLIRAILRCGGNPAAFARNLRINHQTVRNWLSSSYPVPSPQYCAIIESLTDGEIRKEELRPDIFGKSDIPYSSEGDRLQKCIGMLNEIASEISLKSKKGNK